MGLNVYPLLALFAVSLAMSWRYLRYGRRIPNFYRMLAIGIILLFGLFSWLYVPHLNRVFDDEAIILQRSVGYDGSLYLPDTGPQKHMTVQAVYALLFFVAGPSNLYAIKLNIIMSLIALYLLFLLIWRETDDPISSFVALFLMMMLPAYLIQATSSYVMIISIIFLMLSCFSFRAYLRYGSVWTALLLGLCISLLILCRVEFLFIVPILVFWEIVHDLGDRRSRRYFLWLPIPLIVFFFNVIDILRYKAWEYSFDPVRHYSFANIFRHILDIGSLDLRESLGISILFTSIVVLAFISSIIISRRRLAFFLLPSIGISLIGVYTMNSLLQDYYAIPVVLLLCMPLGNMVSSAIRRAGHRWHGALFVALVVVGLMIFAYSYTIVISESERGEHLYLNTYSPKLIERYVPEECIVIATRFTYVSMGTDIRSVDTNLVNSEPGRIDGERCLFFYEDYFCVTDRMIEGTMEECAGYMDRNRLQLILTIRDEKRGLENHLYIINESIGWPDAPVIETI